MAVPAGRPTYRKPSRWFDSLNSDEYGIANEIELRLEQFPNACNNLKTADGVGGYGVFGAGALGSPTLDGPMAKFFRLRSGLRTADAA